MRPARLALCLLLLAAGCAGGRGARASAGTERLVVLAASGVRRPPPQSLGAQLTSEDEPREVLAREVRSALEARGRRVVAVYLEPDGAPLLEARARELAAHEGAQAALLVVLTHLDLSAMRGTGRAQVGLSARLVSVEGRSLWEDARQVGTSVRLYRAQSDWRSHVRQAVVTVLGGLP